MKCTDSVPFFALMNLIHSNSFVHYKSIIKAYEGISSCLEGYVVDFYVKNPFSRNILSRIAGALRADRKDLNEAYRLMHKDFLLSRQEDEWTLRMAEICLLIGNKSLAVNYVNTTYENNKKIKNGFARLGYALRVSDIDACIDLMEKDIRDSRISPEWLLHYAKVQARLNNYNFALDCVEKAYSEDGSVCDGYIGLALLHRDRGELKKAFEVANKDLIANRLGPKGRIEFARLLGIFSGKELASSELRSLLDKSQELGPDLFVKGSQVAFVMEDYALADDFLKKSGELFPNEPGVIKEELRQTCLRATWAWLDWPTADDNIKTNGEISIITTWWERLLKVHLKREQVLFEGGDIPYEEFYYLSRALIGMALEGTVSEEPEACEHITERVLRGLVLFDKSNTALGHFTALLSTISSGEISESTKSWVETGSDESSVFAQLLLADILAWKGLFSLYCIVRRRVEWRAVKDIEVASMDGWRRGFRALVAMRQFSEAKRLIELKSTELGPTAVMGWSGYVELIEGNASSFASNQRKSRVDYSETFYNLVRDKSIAIVGPAISNQDLEGEIGRYDLVIRPNWTPPSHDMSESYEPQIRVDVSYYTKHIFYSLDERTRKIISDKLKCYCIDSFLNTDSRVIKDFSTGRARKPHVNSYFIHKFPNALQRILFDVLSYHPKAVKVFKCNFYLSENLYDIHYTHNIIKNVVTRKSDRVVMESTWAHDLASNFNFIENLYVSGVIDVDEQCRSVLSLGLVQYLEKLEALHGHGSH